MSPSFLDRLTMKFLSLTMVSIFLLLCQYPSSSLARGVASFGGGGRGRRPTGNEEEDYGMPITHPSVMIPLIGLIIMLTVMFCSCCLKLSNSWNGVDPRKNAPVERLQLGNARKSRSPSRSRAVSLTPEYAGLENGAKHKSAKQSNGKNGVGNSLRPDIISNIDLDGLPYDCYRPVKKQQKQEQLV